MADFDPDAYLATATPPPDASVSAPGAPAAASSASIGTTPTSSQPPAFDPDAYLTTPQPETPPPTTRERMRAYKAQLRGESPEIPAGFAAQPGPNLDYTPPTTEQLAHDWGQVAKGVAKGVPASIAGGVAGDVEALARLPFGGGETIIPTSLEGGYLGPRGVGVMNLPANPEEAGGMMIGSMLGPQAALKALKAASALRAARAATTATPPSGPLGVTLSEGQHTGDLAAIRQEQQALRNDLGQPAYQRAQQFAEQQRLEVAAARERVASALDPNARAGAETPQRAADIITDALTQQQQSREAEIADESRRLQPRSDLHPLDAADRVVDALSDSARTQESERAARLTGLQEQHEALRASMSQTGSVLAQSPLDAADIVSGAVSKAAEDAQAAKAAAYETANALPGQFHPASFNNVKNEIATSLRQGAEPTFIDPQRTPLANSALGDLDDILSGLKQTRDPETGKVLPRPPITPQLVDIARQRLNTYLGDATRSARTDPSAWRDVYAMRNVIDGFADAVAKRFADGRFLGGDATAVQNAFAQARRLNTEYRQNFTPRGPGDKVGTAIRDIIGRYDGQAATPEQITNMLYGKGDVPVKIARRLTETFDQDSPEIGAARQGLYSYVFERPGEPFDPAAAADRFDQIASGPGRTLLQSYLSPQQIAAWQAHADALRTYSEAVQPTRGLLTREIAKLTGGETTSQQSADTLFGRQGLGENAKGVQLAQHIRDTYGETSPTFQTLKKGQLARVLRTEDGQLGWDASDVADRVREFLTGRGRPMAETILTPSERELVSAYGDAVRAHAEKLGTQQNAVDRFIARLTGHDGGAPLASLDDAVKLMFRRSAAGDSTALQFARGLREHFGEDSAVWGAFRQGLFRHVVENAEGLKDFGPVKAADNLQKLLNTQLGREVYAPAERQLMGDYVALQRKLEVPQAGANWSNNYPLREKVQQGMSHAFRLVGALIGNVIHPFGGEIAGYAAGDLAAKTVNRWNQAKAARDIAQKMPLLGERAAQYQKAAQRFARTQNSLTRAQVTSATGNLYNSLKSLGVNVKLPELQLPGTAPAQDDKTQQRADGGAVPQPKQDDVPRPEYEQNNHDGISQGRSATELRHVETVDDLSNSGAVSSALCTDDSRPENQDRSAWRMTTPTFASGGGVRRAEGGSVYNTDLGKDESAFRHWVRKNNVPFDPDARGPQDYDMRGFWKALQSGDPKAKSAVDPNDQQIHYPDYWKTPYHATFSNESQWASPQGMAGFDISDAPHWNDQDQLVSPRDAVMFDDRAQRAGGGAARAYKELPPHYDEWTRGDPEAPSQNPSPDFPEMAQGALAFQANKAEHNVIWPQEYGDRNVIHPSTLYDWKGDIDQKLASGGVVRHARINRDAFLYLEDGSNKQCDQCCFFTTDKRCSVITGTPHVEAKWSCGLFIPGKYNGKPTGGQVSAKEAGLVKTQVRCENCRYGGEHCELYEALNAAFPDDFDLDTKIKPKACCNAFEPGGKPVVRAHGGRVDPRNIDHEPTEAQKMVGNYRHDHIHIFGLPITIENAKGSMRRGVGKDGKPWACKLPAAYGFVKRTTGADGQHVDCFVGPHRKAPNAYIIDQIDPDTKKWDEHKTLVGFGSLKQALAIYERAFSDGKGKKRIGHVTTMPIAQFKDWLKNGDTTKPIERAPH